MGRLEGKVAIVTGAAHGLGASHALALAREGSDVAAADICRDLPYPKYPLGTGDELNSVVKEIQALGRRAIAIKCDVTNSGEVEKMVKRVMDEFGKIDVLVNNAGIQAIYAPVWECPEEAWDLTIDIHLKGTFLCCKYVLPHMIDQKSGKVINITSIAGREGQAGNSPYCAAKAGIVTFTHAIAKDVAPYNINVNCVGAGLVMTPMVRGVLGPIAEGMGISVEQVYAGSWGMYQILAREILPEDVSNAVVFLASEEARNINGQVTYVDGGHAAI